MMKQPYYVGLDIGTDSVGYAVTDGSYALLKYKGEPMWGVHLFEEAALNDERRSHRTARRRLDRRQQRILLLQSLFAPAIAPIDESFFIRIKESSLFPEDTTCGTQLFCDPNFTDKDYHRAYPTIHHLIMELIENPAPHDVRLVYLACAWLIAHRGHFLNEVSKENLGELFDFEAVYLDLMSQFPEEKPWHCDSPDVFGDILKKRIGVTKKLRELSSLLYGTPRVPKDGPALFCNREALLRLLCGGTVSPKALFDNEEYAAIDSFSLDKSDDELAAVLSALGDDAELIIKLKALFDWAILCDVRQGEAYISKAKIGVYEQHKRDLATLKHIVRTYLPKKYKDLFRADNGKMNYKAYSKSSAAGQADFCKYVKGLLKDVTPAPNDEASFADMMAHLEEGTLCPKQINANNRVIPHQVYWVELKAILDNATRYLSFLNAASDGYTTAEKILSIFEFRVPYFVGPLNKAGSRFAWVERKAGTILPWNFKDMVDLEKSEQAFIDRMTNTCTYLPDADVLPKNSLCYEKFCLLNELNPLAVGGKRVPVEIKQRLYAEHCLVRKKVTKKSIRDFLLSNNCYTAAELETLSGIDETIKTAMTAHHALHVLLENGTLSTEDAERIIERRTYTESKNRFMLWLEREYKHLSEADRRYIGSLKFKDFGRLSRAFLCELYGTECSGGTGETFSVLERMWSENLTLMELLSDTYTYREQIEQCVAAYYAEHPVSMDDRLRAMYVSNAVKRPILRTLDIVSDIVKARGAAPEKIFVEMARGGKPEKKGQRTLSRAQQVRQLYDTVDTEDVRLLREELDRLGDSADSRLQSDRLFLYYMQCGRCMYTGERIELSQLGDKRYDIDHIYPRSKVKDDSVLNNKVLVLSTANGEKDNVYPIRADIRHTMAGWWQQLREAHFITEEKYRRLVRHEPFSETEQWGFINRQLVETQQSTKAVATLLKERYPSTQIVYVKAGLVSEFRQTFDLLKCRSVNDLHHAKDAFLNIVVGNVYNERFTKTWFLAHRDSYNLKVSTLFTHPVILVDGTTVWEGTAALDRIKNTVYKKNAIHLTRYAFCRKGGLFDQQPVKAAPGLVPLKKGLPTEKYGGYNKPTASFFVLADYRCGKKQERMLVPIDLMEAPRFRSDAAAAAAVTAAAIERIVGKPAEAVSFPLGLREIKIGTVFEFDGGLRAYLTGKGNGGKVIGLSALVPLLVGYEWEKYIKRLETFTEKKKANPRMVYSAEYDRVTPARNVALYDLLCDKLASGVFQKRPANPLSALQNGRDTFCTLNVFEQASCLLQLVTVFSRLGKCDLQAVGGSANAAVVTLSSSLSNWKKNYTCVRIVDSSASGLFTAVTGNLLQDL